METNDITVREFINDYLIKQIGEIKDKQPYFAFVLMAVGIEFLGQCQNDKTKFNSGNSKDNYQLGLSISPLDDDKYSKLYENMRCGLTHSLITKGGLTLSNKESDGSISCEDFYNDFVAACNEVLSGSVPMPKKNLNDIFFVETISDDGSSTTASTPSVVVQKQSV